MAKGAIDHEMMKALEIHPEANLPEASPEEHAALGSHNACNELALDQLHLEKKLELRFRNAAATL